MNCMTTSLMLIAQVIFLSKCEHPHIYTVTDATDHHIDTSATTGMGNDGAVVKHYPMSIHFTSHEIAASCMQSITNY